MPPHETALEIAKPLAPLVTYTAASAATTLWGFHMSDIGVLVSSFAACCGVGLQYLTYRLKRDMLKAKISNVEHD